MEFIWRHCMGVKMANKQNQVCQQVYWICNSGSGHTTSLPYHCAMICTYTYIYIHTCVHWMLFAVTRCNATLMRKSKKPFTRMPWTLRGQWCSHYFFFPLERKTTTAEIFIKYFNTFIHDALGHRKRANLHIVRLVKLIRLPFSATCSPKYNNITCNSKIGSWYVGPQ